MSGFSKLFGTMWHGTLYGKFEASAVFMVLLSLCDADGVVDATPEAIAGLTGWPLDVIEKGLAELQAPDLRSRTPGNEGRRITLLDEHRDWGWSITNYDLYRERGRNIDRREYFADRKRKLRDEDEQKSGADSDEAQDQQGFQPDLPAVHRKSPKTTDSRSRGRGRGRGRGIDDMGSAEAVADDFALSGTAREKRSPKRKSIRGLLQLSQAQHDAPEDWQKLRSLYPRRAGSQRWEQAIKAANARLLEGSTWNEILEGVQRYASFVRSTGKEGTEYVMQARTFLGPDKHFLEAWEAPTMPTASVVKTNVENTIDAARRIFGE